LLFLFVAFLFIYIYHSVMTNNVV